MLSQIRGYVSTSAEYALEMGTEPAEMLISMRSGLEDGTRDGPACCQLVVNSMSLVARTPLEPAAFARDRVRHNDAHHTT